MSSSTGLAAAMSLGQMHSFNGIYWREDDLNGMTILFMPFKKSNWILIHFKGEERENNSMHLFLGEHASRPLLVELQQEQQFLKVFTTSCRPANSLAFSLDT